MGVFRAFEIPTCGSHQGDVLTHWVPVTPYGIVEPNPMWHNDAVWRHIIWSALVQVMVCWLVTPSHYLNHCCLITNEVLWHLPTCQSMLLVVIAHCVSQAMTLLMTQTIGWHLQQMPWKPYRCVSQNHLSCLSFTKKTPTHRAVYQDCVGKPCRLGKPSHLANCTKEINQPFNLANRLLILMAV